MKCIESLDWLRAFYWWMIWLLAKRGLGRRKLLSIFSYTTPCQSFHGKGINRTTSHRIRLLLPIYLLVDRCIHVSCRFRDTCTTECHRRFSALHQVSCNSRSRSQSTWFFLSYQWLYFQVWYLCVSHFSSAGRQAFAEVGRLFVSPCPLRIFGLVAVLSGVREGSLLVHTPWPDIRTGLSRWIHKVLRYHYDSIY